MHTANDITQNTHRQHGLTILSLLLYLIILGGIAFGWNAYANKQRRIAAEAEHKAMIAQLAALDERWIDALKVAAGTGRIALAQPISAMQQIRRDTSALTLNTCLASARQDYVEGMNSIIDAFMAFQRDKTEAEVTPMFQNGRDKIESFRTRAKACTPQD